MTTKVLHWTNIIFNHFLTLCDNISAKESSQSIVLNDLIAFFNLAID